MLTQKAVQTVHLTGRAGEQHEPALIQVHLGLLIRLAQLALDRLCATQQPQVLCILHGDVPHLKLFVHRRAEYHAAAFQRELRQRGEYTARRGVGADILVLVPDGEHGGLAPHLPLLQHRTHMGAVTAADAAFGDLRIEEALLIPYHMDGALGTAAAARAAAGTALTGRQLGLYDLRHGTRLLA